MRWMAIELLYLNSYFATIVFCLHLNETALCATPGVNSRGVLCPIPLDPGSGIFGVGVGVGLLVLHPCQSLAVTIHAVSQSE